MDHSKFLELIRSNQGIIWKLVGLYANTTDEKKDIYQEILFQAWKSISSFRAEAKFSTWLYKVCLNTILTYQRKNKFIVYHDTLEFISPTVEHNNAETENSEALYWAIRQLAETDRALICMHLDGYDNAEVSSLLGISVNHVSVKLYRIKERLSKMLKPI